MIMRFKPSASTVSELMIKKSRFIGIVAPVDSKKDAMDTLKSVQIRYPSAQHYCYAYQISPDDAAYSDDGEPKGCAGKPIYNIVHHQGLLGTLVIVVRYFGGIKLGASGLVRAYANSAKQVLAQVSLEPIIKMKYLTIDCAHKDEQHLRHCLHQQNATLENIRYHQHLSVDVGIAQPQFQTFTEMLKEQGRGQWSITTANSFIYASKNNPH